MTLDHSLDQELAILDGQGLLRRQQGVVSGGLGLIDCCTNDYLGYASRGVSRETGGTAGAGASRLIFGTHTEHVALEAELAGWVGADAALLFPSGYAANVGAVAALVRPGDLVISDELNHASLIDGCRLARARVVVVAHRGLDAVGRALEAPTTGRRWVITESYFSMEGDSPDLRALRSLCDAAGAALYVDEAHALGVFGPHGAGLAREAGIKADVLVGTLGKAVGVQGAFVAGSATLASYLWNRARSLVFTTAPSPLLTAVALDHARAVRLDDAARGRLAHLCGLFEERLRLLGFNFAPGRHGPIFPIPLEAPERAVRIAAALRDKGFLIQAIRPPTVPQGTSRLRIALRAGLADGDVLRLADHLEELCRGS